MQTLLRISWYYIQLILENIEQFLPIIITLSQCQDIVLCYVSHLWDTILFY